MWIFWPGEAILVEIKAICRDEAVVSLVMVCIKWESEGHRDSASLQKCQLSLVYKGMSNELWFQLSRDCWQWNWVLSCKSIHNHHFRCLQWRHNLETNVLDACTFNWINRVLQTWHNILYLTNFGSHEIEKNYLNCICTKQIEFTVSYSVRECGANLVTLIHIF